MLRRVTATRYVTPLREGGSLPGIVEADDLGTYVVKFRGAGQGLRVLVAEVIVGELARRLGLRVPELATIELEPAIARYEADEEVQDLLTASVGSNLAVDFLPGAFGYDARCAVDPVEAATVVWLDAYVANVDRSWRNPNLLVWHRRVWCIDHGAALYFHHTWPRGVGSADRFADAPYDASTHVLGAVAAPLDSVDVDLARRVTPELLHEVLDLVPAEWLEAAPGIEHPEAVRATYVDFLKTRVREPRGWLPRRAAA